MTETEVLTFVDNDTGKEYELPANASDKEIMSIASKAVFKPKCPRPENNFVTGTTISSSGKEVKLGMRLYPFVFFENSEPVYYDYIQIGDVLLYAPDENQIAMIKYDDIFNGLSKKDVKKLSIFRF